MKFIKYIIAFLVGFFGECFVSGVREEIANIKRSKDRMDKYTKITNRLKGVPDRPFDVVWISSEDNIKPVNSEDAVDAFTENSTDDLKAMNMIVFGLKGTWLPSKHMPEGIHVTLPKHMEGKHVINTENWPVEYVDDRLGDGWIICSEEFFLVAKAIWEKF